MRNTVPQCAGSELVDAMRKESELAILGALLVIVSMFAFVVGFIALFQGHIKTFRINDKKAAVALLVVASLMFIGAVIMLPSSQSPSTASTTAAALPTNADTVPASSQTTSDPATAISQPAPNAVRGILSPVDYWRQTFAPDTSNDCVAEGENQLNSQDAWRLPGAALACAQDPIAPIANAWNGSIVSADVYFNPHQDAAGALAAATALLPADIQQIGAYDGVDTTAAYPNGSCHTVVYHSDAAAAAVRQTQPTWTDPDKVSITLYTGNTTPADGSDSTYVPTDVHLAIVGIGGENRGADGTVHC